MLFLFLFIHYGGYILELVKICISEASYYSVGEDAILLHLEERSTSDTLDALYVGSIFCPHLPYSPYLLTAIPHLLFCIMESMLFVF